MSTQVCITVRWLGERFHGLTEDKKRAEWPPSPLRLFQTLVAGAYHHGMYATSLPALQWLERQQAPDILAVRDPMQGNGFDHFVPDNDNLLNHEKPVVRVFKPVLLENYAIVHYVWTIRSDDAPPLAEIDDLVSTLSTFGCGVDQAYACVRLARVAEVDPDGAGTAGLHRFFPIARSQSLLGTLRTPKGGTLNDLNCVFQSNRAASMTRAERRKKRWPTVFDRVVYAGMDTVPSRPHAIFRLLDDSDSPVRYPHARLIHIAGMVRHSAGKQMKDDPPPWRADEPAWVKTFVCGHRGESQRHEQLSYVPLPSIGHEHADALVRNVMLVAPIGRGRDLEYVAARINGLPLEPESHSACAWESECRPSLLGDVRLERFEPPAGKFIDKTYLGTSAVWHSVTPVILDGHSRRAKSDKPEAVGMRTAALIQKALVRAGIETPCEFTWRSVPFIKNCLSAHKYDRNSRHTGYHRPAHLNDLTATHVRIEFERAVQGPIMIGAGRHCGFGLMAAVTT